MLVNVLTTAFVTLFTYRSAVEHDEQRFRRELLDKFLDEAGHWAYFPEGGEEKLKGKTRDGYKTGLVARYHRVHAGIEDKSIAKEFRKRFEEFRKKGDAPNRDWDQTERAIEGIAQFLRENYLK